jgi:hypothetical protein
MTLLLADDAATESQHGGLHGAGAEPVQGLLAGVSASRWRCIENGSGYLSDGRCAWRHQLHGVAGAEAQAHRPIGSR